MILRTIVGRFFAVNCYIVGSEQTKQGMIIDPGERGNDIISLVRELGLNIKCIVLTHTHADHLGALRQVEAALGGEVLVHEAEAHLTKRVMPNAPSSLQDGDIIELGELHFQVLHTPGHSRGGISLFGEGVVFTGDTLPIDSIPRTDLPGRSEAQLADSIMNKIMALPDDTLVLPGHGWDSTIGEERQTNPIVEMWRAGGYGSQLID